MIIFRERVLPPWWVFALTLLFIPVSLVVFLPININLGWIVAAVLILAGALGLIAASPTIRIEGETLYAGRAHVPLSDLGEAKALTKEEGRKALGVGYDAAAYHSTAPWMMQLVRIEVEDPDDPTTAWVLSTRKAEELLRALSADRTQG